MSANERFDCIWLSLSGYRYLQNTRIFKEYVFWGETHSVAYSSLPNKQGGRLLIFQFFFQIWSLFSSYHRLQNENLLMQHLISIAVAKTYKFKNIDTADFFSIYPKYNIFRYFQATPSPSVYLDPPFIRQGRVASNSPERVQIKNDIS